jgi:hypothetical protein
MACGAQAAIGCVPSTLRSAGVMPGKLRPSGVVR